MSFASCPNSLLAYFPEDIYRYVGSSAVLPQWPDAVDQEKLVAVQFLRGGLVRLTWKDSKSCDDVIQRGLSFGETPIRVSHADAKIFSVHLRDLPAEISGDDVSSFFSSFGEVLSVTRSTFDGFPALYNGNCVVKIALDNEMPYFVRVHDFPCRAWYAGQPPQCSVYRKFSHRASDCPLSGLCRRCHQPGHLARECRQSWGSVHPDTEVLVGGPLARGDNSMEYVPHFYDGASMASDDGKMASGDAGIAANAAPPQPLSTLFYTCCFYLVVFRLRISC